MSESISEFMSQPVSQPVSQSLSQSLSQPIFDFDYRHCQDGRWLRIQQDEKEKLYLHLPQQLLQPCLKRETYDKQTLRVSLGNQLLILVKDGLPSQEVTLLDIEKLQEDELSKCVSNNFLSQ